MARVTHTTIATMPWVGICPLTLLEEDEMRYGSVVVVVLLACDGAVELAELVDDTVGIALVDDDEASSDDDKALDAAASA